MRLNLRQVEAFRAVFQTNSMTAAAALMGVTQQAISRLIRDLEAEIDLPLFDRQGRRLLATPDAVALNREVQRSFYGLDRIARAASELRRKRTGAVSIAASGAPSFYLLPEIINQFRLQWPSVLLSLNVLSSSDVLDTVALQHHDLGIADVAATAPGVEIEPLASLNFVCALPADHALTRRRVIKPKDLDGLPLLMISQASHQHQRILKVLSDAGITLDIVFEASNGGPICALVARNAGVAILDPITAAAHRRDGVVLRRFAPALSYELKIVYPANRPRTDRVRAFADLVHQNLEDFKSP